MDFPSQYPDSPAKPLAGPARARVLARQNRTLSLKPYARPSSGLTPSGSSASLHTDTDSPARNQPSTPAATAKTLAPPSNTRSAFSPLRVAASPIALLGSVRKMVTRPLAWLTSAAASVEPDLGIPTSSSTNSLSSIARTRAAAQASLKPSSGETSYEQDAPTRAARAVGERLAAGLRSRSRSNLHDDEESQLRPPTSTLSSSASMSRLAPGPAPARTTRKHSPFDQASPLAGPSSLPKSAASAMDNKAMTWSSRSSKRMLDVASRYANPDDSLEVLSDAGPASPPQAQPYHSRSHQTLRSPRSQLLGGYRGSSLRPDDAMSECGSTSISHSNSFSAFGYGNEVRYADSAFGLPPSSSPFQLSSRTAATRRNRAPFSSGLFTHTGTSGRSSRAGSISLRTASPAPSAGHSPARAREGTPQRRNWNGINLAAPSAPSVGDEMMRDYLASRTLPSINPTVRRSLGLPAEEPIFTSSSVAGGSVMDETESLTPSRLGKRDIDMSVDGDSERLGAAGTPFKRRMVWHPELGFISHEELKAREPKLPSPKNEAERLLNVLETMRKPTNTSRGVGFSKGPPTSINVPAPISDLPASASRSTKSQEGKPAIGVAPYTRYLRKAKAVQSTEEQGGMRARLKKSQRNVDRMETDDAATEESVASEEEDVEEEAEEEEESEEEPVPQPEPVRRSRRLQHQAPSAEEVTQTPVKQADKPARTTQLKSALKATPLRPSAQSQATPAKAAETPRPASHRIPLSAASKPPSSTVKKDNFAVKTSTSDPSAPRERSSLRQGATKTSRTHQSSGKFSAWDEDEEEEDLPDASDLAKIKLPANMFPTGFSFGSSAPSSAPAAATKPAASTSIEAKAAPAETVSSAGSSLLGRLGGFDSSAPAEQKDAPKTSAAAASFSFSAPSKDAPNTMPKFSFGASATAPLSTATKDDGAAKKSTAPPASDFFSKPAEPASKSLGEGKKDGPVPNFFGSTMKKFETKSTDAPAAPAAAASGGFSFGAPAAEKTSDKPTFSFGAKPATESAPAASSPFGSFGAKPAETAEKKADAAPASKPSFFGSSSSTSTPAVGGFSSGAPASTTAASSGSKRGADDDDEPATKKSMPSFSFGSPAVSKPADQPAAPAASNGFSFGAPPPAAAAGGEKKDETPSAKPSSAPNFFGAKGDDAISKPSTPSSGFSFGKPASDSGFGAPKPADASTPSSTGFSFGTAKTATDAAPKPAASTGGFTFGSSSSASGSPAPEVTSNPTFSFGALKPAVASAEAASTATSAPGSGATTPNGSFVFGSSSTDSSAAKPVNSSSGGFSFGAPATSTAAVSGAGFGSATGSSMSGGFGGFGSQPKPPTTTAAGGGGGGVMMDDSPAKTAPASSTPSFTFGSATPSATPATPAAGAGGMSFTFGTPSSSAAPPTVGSPSTFTFGAPSGSSSSSSTGGNAGGGGFRFGSPAPSSSAPAPGASTGFTFGSSTTGSTTPGVGSTPASPFLAPSNAPTTPGGSPFQFGAPAPAASAATGSSPFQFGTPSGATSAPATSGGFTFGAGQPSTPNPNPTFGTSTPGFGGGGGFGGTPTTPAAGGGGFSFGTTPNSGMPQMPQMPQQPGLFSMGAAPSANPNSPATTPGGRQIKPLRQRRR